MLQTRTDQTRSKWLAGCRICTPGASLAGRDRQIRQTVISLKLPLPPTAFDKFDGFDVKSAQSSAEARAGWGWHDGKQKPLSTMRAIAAMDIGPEAAARVRGSEVCKGLVTCWGEACTDYLRRGNPGRYPKRSSQRLDTPALTIKGCGGTKRVAKIRGPEAAARQGPSNPLRSHQHGTSASQLRASRSQGKISSTPGQGQFDSQPSPQFPAQRLVTVAGTLKSRGWMKKIVKTSGPEKGKECGAQGAY